MTYKWSLYFKVNGEEVAGKVFTPAGQMRPMDVQVREYQVMNMLNHENIVKLLAIEEEVMIEQRHFFMYKFRIYIFFSKSHTHMKMDES